MGRPFKDGGRLISTAHAEVRFASRETNQPPPGLLHMRSGTPILLIWGRG